MAGLSLEHCRKVVCPCASQILLEEPLQAPRTHRDCVPINQPEQAQTGTESLLKNILVGNRAATLFEIIKTTVQSLALHISKQITLDQLFNSGGFCFLKSQLEMKVPPCLHHGLEIEQGLKLHM